MKILYFDCFSGISGDMVLAAMLDLGLSLADLRAMVASLPVERVRIEAERITRQGITGHVVRVIPDEQAKTARHLHEIQEILDHGSLPPPVRETAGRVFRLLAEAEAQIHGVTPEEVHFHEVGAVDSIVDIVGAAWGLHTLGIRAVYASPVPTGTGTVETAHGTLPVPAPATMALLARCRAPLRASPATTELVTPTGAALLAALARFEQPDLSLEAVGYGFGQKTLPWPNVLRLWLGEGTPGLEGDRVSILEANLDDESPEILGAAMETLLDAGALDVSFTPIQMKKNRPAVKLTVLAEPARIDILAARVLEETSTLGVRIWEARRLKSPRRHGVVETPWGEVAVKVKQIGQRQVAAPEFEACRRAARAAGVPIAEVYRAAIACAQMGRIKYTEDLDPPADYRLSGASPDRVDQENDRASARPFSADMRG